MMRTLFFDCFAGASGDMILGALVGVGVDPRALLDQLSLLDVAGYLANPCAITHNHIQVDLDLISLDPHIDAAVGIALMQHLRDTLPKCSRRHPNHAI